MFKKFYNKVKNFTYFDIGLMNFIVIFISLLTWLIYLLTDDMSIYEGNVDMLVQNIFETLYIHLFIWMFSSLVCSFVLFMLKRKKRTKHDKDYENWLDNEKRT